MLMNTRQVVALVAVISCMAGCRSLGGSAPLDLSGDGVQASPVVQDTQGQTLAYNFRAVEPGVLYRASEFNRERTASGQPVAFQDGQLFEFLRKLNVHRVITLAPLEDFYGEQGYFQYWTQRTGYQVTTTSVIVEPADVYGTNDRSGLHAAAELMSVMRARRREDGAVLIHGEAGKDTIGIMAAAYELARTVDHGDESSAWSAVVRRYLASNTLAPLAPGTQELRANSLEAIRPQLLFVARLF